MVIPDGIGTLKVPGKTNASGRGSTDTSYTTYFVPFVRGSQNFVNASLVINTSPSDTVFYYKCDWQYSEWQNNANGYSDTAMSYAVFFMVMDRAVFGHTKFKITDSLLFRHNNHKAVSVWLDSLSVGGKGNDYYTPVELCQQTTTWGQNCPWLRDGLNCNGPNGTCDNCSVCIEPTTTTYCWTIWALVVTGGGSGGTGGTGGTGGGGGSGGSQTPPNCNPTAVKGANANPNCEPGWQPDPTQIANNIIQQLENWDDSIIINSSVRPRTVAILDSIRNMGNGNIASMIYFMSLQVPAFNWEIREASSLAPPYHNANAVTVYGAPNPFSTTDLNLAMMGNATNISMARTILHESVHAFIYNWVYNSPALTQSQKDSIYAMPFAKKLKKFFQAFYPYKDNLFHNTMAVQFKNDIKNLLKVLCPKLGIILTPNELEIFCNDLAWGGLQDNDPNSPWSELPDFERARIIARNSVELNNLSSFSGNIDVDGVLHYVSLTRIGTKTCP